MSYTSPRRIAGEAFGFGPAFAGIHLPAEWRDLDRAVWQWVRAHGGDEAVALAAGWTSHADGQGHSALPLAKADSDGHPLLSSAQTDALRESDMVSVIAPGGATAARPLVLEQDHLFLARNHRAEVAVACALAARRKAACKPVQPVDEADLRALFNGSWCEEEARQRDAVKGAPGRRLMVLTGGPGTGKTTTVLRMLLALSREHAHRQGRLPRVRVAAPTGKAAQRLVESLHQGATHLLHSDTPIGADWQAHLDAVLAAPSGTVHRMLGSRGRHGGFRHGEGGRLPVDIMVIDEASMLDLRMLRAVLAALPEEAVLVLVGDADQLTSVGTGSVMMDLVQALEADPRGDLIRLEHCFRADDKLVPIHRAVRAGDAEAFERAREAAARVNVDGRPAMVMRHVPDITRLRRLLAPWAEALQGAMVEAGITRPVSTDEQALARLALTRQRQLLCAQREGAFGSVAVAATLAARIRQYPAFAQWAGQTWYPGRIVIITRNDAAAGLYNGDIGICIARQGMDGRVALKVVFESGSAEGSAVRHFDPDTLPPHEDAFALTIHKSQGSEYGHVAVLLPPDPESPLLVRQSLYTGLSRARHSVELWSTPESTGKALATVLRRHGLLASRIGASMANTAQDDGVATPVVADA